VSIHALRWYHGVCPPWLAPGLIFGRSAFLVGVEGRPLLFSDIEERGYRCPCAMNLARNKKKAKIWPFPCKNCTKKIGAQQKRN
jgi:hypothetical protein